MDSTDTKINWTKEHRLQPTSSEHTLAQRREHPYIWATWLPRLLTGENPCEWAVWFKAHHQDWTRTPSEFSQVEWMLNHTALLNKRKGNWKHSGFDVNIEGQNSFQLQGRSATLAGQPDLITQRDGQAVIVDVKNGQDSAGHVVQVMIYLYAIPRAIEQYRNLKLRGQVTYDDHTVRIPAEAVDDQFIQNLGALIRRLSADSRPPECRADRNVASATSQAKTVQTVWTRAPSPKAQLPATSESPTWRRCQFKRLVR